MRGGLGCVGLEVIDASLHGFLARADALLPLRTRGSVRVQLGANTISTEEAVVVRCVSAAGGPCYGFRIATPSRTWQQGMAELHAHDSPQGGPQVVPRPAAGYALAA
jgi:hypothetical protein